MPSSKRLVVTAAVPYSILLYRVAHSLRLVDMRANDQRIAVTLKYRIIAMEMMKTARSVHFLPPNTVFAGKTPSRTNHAI